MPPRNNSPAERDFVETATFWLVGFALALVPALVFFFSFGNVGLLGTSLGVEHWIAFLTGPAVDLSVAGCVIAASYLSAKGRTEKQLWPLHVAAIFCGMLMVALNTGGAVYIRHWRLAAFDSVGPALLIGWGFIAPWLWRNLTEAKRSPAVPAGAIERPIAGDLAAPPAIGDGDVPQAPVDGEPQAPAANDRGASVTDIASASRNRQRATVSAARERSRIAGATDSAGANGMNDEQWAKLAAPVYRELMARDGAPPSGPKLLAEIVNRGLAKRVSPTRARAIRVATEKHLGIAKGPEESGRDDEPEIDGEGIAS